jgi:hypothetical protein
MSDNPGYGFVSSPSSAKKELEAPKASPAVVNNYFAVAIDPQAVLLVFLLGDFRRVVPFVQNACLEVRLEFERRSTEA